MVKRQQIGYVLTATTYARVNLSYRLAVAEEKLVPVGANIVFFVVSTLGLEVGIVGQTRVENLLEFQPLIGIHHFGFVASFSGNAILC